MNLTARARNEPPIADFEKHVNWTAAADGLVGGHLPVVSFTFPIRPDSPYTPPATRLGPPAHIETKGRFRSSSPGKSGHGAAQARGGQCGPGVRSMRVVSYR